MSFDFLEYALLAVHAEGMDVEGFVATSGYDRTDLRWVMPFGCGATEFRGIPVLTDPCAPPRRVFLMHRLDVPETAA